MIAAASAADRTGRRRRARRAVASTCKTISGKFRTSADARDIQLVRRLLQNLRSPRREAGLLSLWSSCLRSRLQSLKRRAERVTCVLGFHSGSWQPRTVSSQASPHLRFGGSMLESQPEEPIFSVTAHVGTANAGRTGDRTLIDGFIASRCALSRRSLG